MTFKHDVSSRSFRVGDVVAAAVVLLMCAVASYLAFISPTTHPHLRRSTYTPGMIIYKKIWISPNLYLEYQALPRFWGDELKYDQHLWVWKDDDLGVTRSSVQEMLDELDQVSGVEK